MTANFFGLFSQAGSLAKSNAETTAAKSARVAGLVQDGYRRWFDGVTASVNDAGRLAGEFGKVRSPADLAALHREWLNTTQARVTEGVQGFLDVSAKIAAEVAILPVPNVTVAVKTAGPVLVKPVVVVAKTEAPAKAKAPVVETPVVEAPVVKAPVVEPVVVEATAPVVEAAAPEAPAPVAVVEAPVEAPVEATVEARVEAAPAVEVAPVAEAAPVDAAPVETVEAAAPEAPAPVAAKPPVKAGPQRRVGGRPAGRPGAQR
jgi:hypothetical protein